MTTIQDIYKGAVPFINSVLQKELIAQGHHLTGRAEESLDATTFKEGKAEVMEGIGVYYLEFVNNGFPARSASFKQVPFLIEYFIKRLGSPVDARAMAFATIAKWMKEGMPTPDSSRFSSVTRRKLMVENAFQDNKQKIDEYITNGIDFVVEERFQLEKSETI